MAGPWHKMGRESWSSCVSVSRLGSKPGQAEIFYDLGMDEFGEEPVEMEVNFCEGCEGYRTAVLVYAVVSHVGCNVVTMIEIEEKLVLSLIYCKVILDTGHSIIFRFFPPFFASRINNIIFHNNKQYTIQQ